MDKTYSETTKTFTITIEESELQKMIQSGAWVPQQQEIEELEARGWDCQLLTISETE